VTNKIEKVKVVIKKELKQEFKIEVKKDNLSPKKEL